MKVWGVPGFLGPHLLHDACPGSQIKDRISHTYLTSTQTESDTVRHTTHTLLLISCVSGQVKVPLFLYQNSSVMKAEVSKACHPSMHRDTHTKKYSIFAEWFPRISLIKQTKTLWSCPGQQVLGSSLCSLDNDREEQETVSLKFTVYQLNHSITLQGTPAQTVLPGLGDMADQGDEFRQETRSEFATSPRTHV